jgi:hypothetical protein
LNVIFKTNRQRKDFSELKSDYDQLAKKLNGGLRFKSTQMADDAAINPSYNQVAIGALKAVAAKIDLQVADCKAHYTYRQGQFGSRCEVPATWPGLMAQPGTLYSQYLDKNNVGSIVQITLSPLGWRADFTGEEKNVGQFKAIETHLSEAVKAIAAGDDRLFFIY